MSRQEESAKKTRATFVRSQTSSNHRHKLRTHEKSRGGCQNCKVRHVKCDQGRPHCKRCLSYGVHCNFVNGVPELQLAASGAMHIIEPKHRALLVAKHDTGPWKEAALLAKFRNDVATTISFGKRLDLFQNEIVVLSHSSPSLKHAMISLTLMQDRCNFVWDSPGTVCRRKIPSLSEQEIGHWYLATSCFNTDLNFALSNEANRRLDIQQQAALCATSVLLVVLTFCYIEATTPEEAWPLAGGLSPSTPEDLQWIRMSNGKLSAQTLTRDLATDPVFRHLVFVDNRDSSTVPSYNSTLLSSEQEHVIELDHSLHGPEVDAFMRIAHSNNFITIIFNFWSFIGDLSAEFEYDLRRKKPTALLVLLYWYTKLNSIPLWWLKARTTLEGRAICIFLGRYYGHDLSLRKLLRWPVAVLSSST